MISIHIGLLNLLLKSYVVIVTLIHVDQGLRNRQNNDKKRFAETLPGLTLHLVQ